MLAFGAKSYSQFVVSDPAALQALERANAVQLKDFAESMRSGQSLMQIQGMQKDMVDIYKKSAEFVQNINLFIQIGERLLKLEKEFENFQVYEGYYKKKGSGAINQLQTITNCYVVAESLINTCTQEGLTPGDRVNLLTTVDNALTEAMKIIQTIKSVLNSEIVQNATKNIFQDMIYSSQGWSSMDVNFSTNR